MEDAERIWEEKGLRVAVLAGDQRAWRTWYDRHFDALYTWVFYRTGCARELAEDLTQECWLVAARRIRRFDPEKGSFLQWMRGIAVNLLRNEWRRIERWKRVRDSLAEIEAKDPEHGRKAGPEVLSGLREQILSAFSELPARYEAVLRAKYQQGLTVAEIAAEWDEGPKAIESLLSRARTAFRGAYRRLEDEPCRT